MKKNKLIVVTILVVLMLAISACEGRDSQGNSVATLNDETDEETVIQQETEDSGLAETAEPTLDPVGYFPVEDEGVELPDLPVEWDDEEYEVNDEVETEAPTNAVEAPPKETENTEETTNKEPVEAPNGGQELPDSSFDGDF